ncbi:MAG: efflux RND transporter periplasmic adaptor subunit [Betaproteobacteria bacterium]|nr:efflux RND transporter periplasmic adaptor subunit [Betaproteobacteria bacterium]MDE2047374.1 efflux RND transporter periplasmic adaptor subunit [Betaproteobacteria bacterium]
MKTPTLARLAGAVAVLAALAGAGYGLYALGMSRGMAMAPAPSGGPTAATGSDPSTWTMQQGEAATQRHVKQGIKAGDVDPLTGRKVLYYQDPMVPGKRFEAPGKSPFMDMMLVPVYAGAAGGDASSVTVSPRIQQNLGLRTAPVVQGTLTPQIEAVGSIAWNEREQDVVQARASGYVERLYLKATLDRVQRGQPLVSLYVPDWVAAQQEYLAVRHMQGDGIAGLADAARQRMRQLGMSDAQIAAVERSNAPQPRITLSAPISGVVTELAVREGMTVMPGATLFRINGTGSVWAQADVPESQAALLRPGAVVQATSPALPGETFTGRVQALLPDVNPATRTRKARLEINNPRGLLAPGMFVRMRFADAQAHDALLVPTDAIIDTGKRTVVMLAEGDGHFRPVTVRTGLDSGGRTEVLSGLQAGQQVVISAQFLIDSEASLQGLEARLEAGAPAASASASAPASASASAAMPGASAAAALAPTAAPTAHTPARVEAVGAHSITLTHPAIAALKWPGMTMEFDLPASTRRPTGLKAGDAVEVDIRLPEGEMPQVTAITRAPTGASIKAQP